jgi:hypothetical protein
MSCGSRATQEKPEALIILFRAIFFAAFFAGSRRLVFVRPCSGVANEC